MTEQILTQERLKELLHYCPKTGMFTRKMHRSGNARINDIAGNIHTGTFGKKYVIIKINDKQYKAHRLAVLYMTGKFPEVETDHDDGNGINNKWDNLKRVSHANNMKNLKLHKGNTSSVCGVSWSKKDKRWRSYINVNKKYFHLGNFINFNDAVIVRKMAEYKHGFHENHGEIRRL